MGDQRTDIDHLIAGLDSIDAIDPAKVRSQVDAATLKLRIEREARQRLEAEARPDYSATIKDGNQLAAELDREAARYVIDGVIDWDSTTLLTAASNAGGSTLLLNVAHSLLTGRPLLGLWDVAQEPWQVLWVNPEEQETTPLRRLKLMGTTKAQRANFRQVWARDRRLYFNRPEHVAALLEDLPPTLDSDRPLVVIIDGFTPTLDGTPWNEDLEAWKNGVGQMRQVLQPAALFVRTQSTAAGQRGSRKYGQQLSAEDSTGGQIMQWPDNRWALNRPSDKAIKGGADKDDRRLTLRGRLMDGERTMTYGWDPKTWRLASVNVSKSALTELEVKRFLQDPQAAWASHGLDSKRKVAAWLSEQHGGDPSERTYQRALEGWEFNQEAGLWQRT